MDVALSYPPMCALMWVGVLLPSPTRGCFLSLSPLSWFLLLCVGDGAFPMWSVCFLPHRVSAASLPLCVVELYCRCGCAAFSLLCAEGAGFIRR